MNQLKLFLRILLNLLYPRRCPVCHRILKDQKSWLCPECASLLHPITGDYCLKCGRPVPPEEEYCPECRKRKRIFTQGRSAYPYDGRMRRSIVRYKYYGSREYGRFYGESICRYLGRDIRRWNPDLIIPVPLTRRKRRMRGFNQAEDLAFYIGRQLEIPAAPDVLIKIRETKSQKKLNAVQRRSNLLDAFRVTERLDGLDILLADDVFTTGSTVEAAAACLKRAGARNVYFVTVCTVPR